MAKKKRTAKQIAAFKKMRAALKKHNAKKHKAKQPSVSHKTIKGRCGMVGKKEKIAQKKHIAHLVYGKPEIIGKTHHKKHHKKSKLMGFALPAGNTAQDAITAVLAAIVGAVAGSAVSAQVPGIKSNYRPYLPVLGGVALNMFSKNKMLKNAGIGMATVGGVFLTKPLTKNLTMLAGGSAPVLVPTAVARPKLLGVPAKMSSMGIPAVMRGFRTSASL